MIDHKRAVPVYIQLADELRSKILDGMYGPDELLPSESEMIRQYSVSRVTVRQATTMLAEEGLVRKVQGKGTFIAAPTVEQNFLGFHDFAQELRKRGQIPTFKILKYAVEQVPKTLQSVFKIGPAGKVHSIHRLKLGDGIPIMFERLFLPVDTVRELPEAELHSKWLTELLPTHYGLHLSRAHKIVQPVLIGDNEASLLGVSPRSLGLLVDRITWVREIAEKPVLVTRSIVRGDIARFYVDLNLEQPDKH